MAQRGGSCDRRVATHQAPGPSRGSDWPCASRSCWVGPGNNSSRTRTAPRPSLRTGSRSPPPGLPRRGSCPWIGPPRWLRVQRALRWTGLLLMVWAANGLPFDVLTAAGLIGHRTASGAIVLSSVYWPGLATRALALAAVVVLARLALARPAAPASTRPASWYGVRWRSCSRCHTRFSGCTGRWEERSGSSRRARPARAGNHC